MWAAGSGVDINFRPARSAAAEVLRQAFNVLIVAVAAAKVRHSARNPTHAMGWVRGFRRMIRRIAARPVELPFDRSYPFAEPDPSPH
jgi:hypothetical protein